MRYFRKSQNNINDKFRENELPMEESDPASLMDLKQLNQRILFHFNLYRIFYVTAAVFIKKIILVFEISIIFTFINTAVT